MPEALIKNQSEERFAPDFIHSVTFGSPPRNSVPASLINKDEWNQMFAASGRFSSLKRTIEITNEELYKYLRLGVSTQSASYLKWMGYETPESLTESPLVSPLLPDHLARTGFDYPVKFIEMCAAEGVSAVLCQMVIRRGMTDRHMEGPLTLSQLLYAFSNIVKKNVTPTVKSENIQPSLINFVCDGTIPFEFIKSGELPTQGVLAMVREILLPDPESELTLKLRSDEKLFRSFSRSIGRGGGSIEKLVEVIDVYGFDVLELRNPMLCLRTVGSGEERHSLGYQVARYAEEFESSAKGSRFYSYDQSYYGWSSDSVSFAPPGNAWGEQIKVNFLDVEALYKAGVETHVAYKQIVEEGMDPSSLIAAKQDGVEVSLMSGAL